MPTIPHLAEYFRFISNFDHNYVYSASCCTFLNLCSTQVLSALNIHVVAAQSVDTGLWRVEKVTAHVTATTDRCCGGARWVA